MTKTLVIGLGNPLLGDDGVGWRVAEAVKRELEAKPPILQSHIDVECFSLGGLSLMERLIGYDRAIIVDALNLGHGRAGEVQCFDLNDLPNPASGHLASAHETNLQTALAVGRTMNARLPDKITVVAIESPPVYDFSEDLTPPVAAAVPLAVRQVLKRLEVWPYGFP
jgi:hydrogenase maturation protease